MRLILEQRYLFDGSVAPATHTLRHAVHEGTSERHSAPDLARHAPAVAAEPAPAAQPAPATAARDVLFVDQRIANWQTLANGVAPNVDVVLIDPARDGLKQVTDALAQRSGVGALHFLTYGSAGEADLGTTAVTAASLASRGAEVASWRDHLSGSAQIDFWGCDVGAGSAGKAFVEQLHALTGAGVAASTDATGAATLHGDWTLERTVGVDAVRTPFTDVAIASYQEVLDRPQPTVSFAGAPASVLLGSTVVEHVLFQNTAATAAGYAPFIDVFASTDSAERATLTSATYSGAALTVTPVTLSTTVTGHAGVLGALHPLAVDNTGAPLFVTAPAGFVAGDTLYVVQLPFGSYTPGQPAAQVDLTFSEAATSELTSSHGMQLNIAAVGGFQYGADPLNDPQTDPSIRGTSATEPAGASDAGNGLASAAADVTLLNFSSSVSTPYGEGETATGPSFPEYYVVTLTPAPATTGDPIQNLSVNFALPDGVIYTGGNIAVSNSSGTAHFVAGTGADGGTVNATFGSIDAGNGATTISIPVYTGRTYNSGSSVLDPVTGAPVAIAAAPASYSGGTWSPRAGSLDAGTTVPVAGMEAMGQAVYTAKSLAVQESAVDQTNGSSANFVPGDLVQYTIHFQISDYAGLDHLQLQSLLSDGLTVDPSVAPVLTVSQGGTTSTVSLGTISEPAKPVVNGQTVATTGSAPYWTYSRDNATTGQTTLGFDAGGALQNATGSSIIEGTAATGTLTFTARVLDKYTTTNIDPATMQPGSISESDTVTSTAQGRGDLLTAARQPTSNPATQVSDASAPVTLSEAPGGISLAIVAINGIAVPANTPVKPGDIVTYRTTYTLTSGDFQKLQLSDYLPLPIFTTTDPTANGSNTAFTASAAGTYPQSGTYRLVTAPAGVAIQGVAVDGTSNNITFNLGQHDDPNNASGQKIAVDFTVTASQTPAADNLLLTTQAQSTFQNAEGSSTANSTINQVVIQEPNLVLKSGVVSVANDAGAAKPSAAYIGQVTFGPTDPTPIFNVAGSTGTPFKGAIPTYIGLAENLNVSGVDGADTTRIVATVQNTGRAVSGAFDVTVSGVLPTGLSLSQVTNFQVIRGDGQAVSFTRPDGSPATLADFFTPGGIKLSGVGGANNPVLTSSSDSNNGYILFIVYDVKLPANESAGTTLTGSASIVNYSSQPGGVASGFGFVTNGTPVGGTAASILDTETISTILPSLTKTAAASNVPEDDNADPGYFSNNTVVIGETRPITITVTLPEGSLTNGTSDVMVQEALPAGETFGNLVSITTSAGVTLMNQPAVKATVNGNVVTFDLGSSVVNANPDGSGTVSILYNALFPTGYDRQTLYSSASLIYSGTAVPPATLNFINHEPRVVETITDNSGGNIYSHEVITYTVTLTNTGLVDAKAVSADLSIPSGLTYVPGSFTYVSGGTGATTNDTVANDLQFGIDAMTHNNVRVFTFQATVDPNLAANAGLNVQTKPSESTYSGVPPPLVGRTYVLSASDVRFVNNFSSILYIDGEANGTAGGVPTQTNPVTSAPVTVGDVVKVHAAVTVPEGRTANVALAFSIPDGFTYDPTSVRIAFVSPGGDVISSTIDPTGSNPAVQVTGQVNNATYLPTYSVPIQYVQQSGNILYVLLGVVQNNDGSPLPNAAIVELNAVVRNVAANTDGHVLSETLNVNGSNSAALTETIKEPHVGITKLVTAVNSGTGTVTYKVTLTNTGDATAYAVTLNDPESSNEQPIANLAMSGGATNVAVISGNGTNALKATLDLAAGASESFTYNVTLTNLAAPVPDVVSTEVYQDLNGGVASLNGTTSGLQGTASGGRDGVTQPLSLNNYSGSVTAGLGVATGRVYQALGNTPGTYDAAIDTPLAGVLVTATTAGPDGVFGTTDDLVQTTTTAADGTYSVALLPDGVFHIALPASGSSGLPAQETLVYNAYGTTNVPAQASASTMGSLRSGVNFAYELPDTAPVLGNIAAGTRQVTAGTPILLSSTGAATVMDTELDRLANAGYSYTGTVLVLQRYVGGTASPTAGDIFTGDGTLVLAGGNATLAGLLVGTYTQTGGTLSLTFNANASAQSVAGVLDHVQYTHTAGNSFDQGVTIGATLADGNTTGLQGTGGVHTSTPVLVTFDVAPSTVVNDTYTEPNDAPAAGNAVTIDPTLTLSNASGSLSQATVAITTNYAAGEDVLLLPAGTPGVGDISGAYANGVLTLTSASGNATLAQYQAALRAVRFYDGSDRPSTAPRTIAISITSKPGGSTATAAAATVAVVPVNDSPVLDPAAPVSLAAGTEDSGAPTGAVGTLVSTLAGAATDPDGANAANGAAPGLAGIAIVTADTSKGNWYYSLDGGTSWTEFAGTAIAAVISGSNALHLVGDASTRIYFQPTVANFNGAVPNALQFRAWDQFDPRTNGALAALPSDSALGTGSNTLASSYSAAVRTLPIAVAAVNDAPVASGSATLAPTVEDTASPPGANIASLFGASFADTADQQMTAGNPTGSVANTLAGVAITGNTTPASEGVWRYSLDGGTTWTALPANLSDSSALVLSASARIDFLPAPNFNGAPPPLVTRLIDSSADVPVSGATTGAALAASTQAIAGVDVSGTHNGGTAAVSGNTVPLATSVAPVNDAPLGAGSATLASTAEDTASPPGATVASLFGATFSDPNDQQTSAANPTGSTANTLAGVAITGNSTPASEGVWRYSLDGGTTWTALPANLSESNALVLSASARIDFLPTPNFNGAPPPLVTRLIDSSTDVPVSGATTGATLAATTQAIAGVDVSGAHNGGTTAVSASTVPLATSVAPVNDAPIGTGSATLASTGEDTASPPGATVASLFGANFSDPNDQQTSAANLTGSTANTLAGVAITGNTTPASEGVWRYSLDGGATWTVLPANLSDSNALVLSASARIDFLPAPNFNGAPPPLVTRLIDSSTDVPVVFGTTGAALAASTQAIAGVDVSGTHNGGTTAVSAGTVPLATAVTPSNDAPVGSGSATLAATAEDTASPPGATVASLFGATFSDPNDQQASAANSTGSSANTLAGVAITGNTTPASEGTWRYSLDGGATWTALPTNLSDSNALVLSASARIDFLPAPNFNGAPPPLVTRLIDSSTDVLVSGATTGAALAASTQAIAGVDVSGTHNGGTTAVSAGTVPLATTVAPVNDAPIATGTANLPAPPLDSSTPTSATVATLFGPEFSDPADAQRNAANPTGSQANTLAGIAIVADPTPAAQGVWRYSTDGGQTFVNVPTTVSDSNALLLPASALLQFVPASGFIGTPQPLQTRLIDTSTDVPLAPGLTGAGLATGGVAVAGIDVSGTHQGGTTSVSAGLVPVSVLVNTSNHAPVATGSAGLTSTIEDAASPPGNTVALLFGANFSDNADALNGANFPNGPMANTLAGVAITGNTTPASEGVWRYSLDGGTTWTALPANLSDSNAFLLSASARLDFLPAPNFNGAPPPLLAHLIDSSTQVPVTGQTTGADIGNSTVAIAGVDVSGTHQGGATAVSTGTVPLATTVTPVNDAPVGTGSATLAATAEDTASPPGATAASLFGANFNDTADQQAATANPTGSSANTLAGVAVTGNTTPASEGLWRYSLDGGATWTALPTNLSDSNALVLSASARIDFLPAPNFNGAPPPLVTRLIDSSTDVPVSGVTTGAALASSTQAIAGVDVSGTHNGGTTAISASIVPLATTVSAINDAPIAAGTATLPTVTENAASPPGSTVTSLFAGTLSDTADAQRTAANPTGSVPNGFAGVAIIGNASDPSQGVYRYSTDGGQTWTVLPPNLSDSNALVLGGTVQLDFVPAANFSGTPGGLTARVIEASSDVPVATGLTGAALAGTAQVRAGVDVSGANDGGRTAVSQATVALLTNVAATDVSPIAGGPAVLPPIYNGDPAPGESVRDLYSPSYSSPHNDPLTGIVLVGDAATPGQGTYRYSLDGGQTFTDVPSNLSPQNGLLLPATAILTFVPAPGFSGMPGGLVSYLVGGTSTFVAPGLRGSDVAGLTSARVVDISGVIGNPTGPLTAGSVGLSTTILIRAPASPIPPASPVLAGFGVPFLTMNADTDRDRDDAISQFDRAQASDIVGRDLGGRNASGLYIQPRDILGRSRFDRPAIEQWSWLEGGSLYRFVVAEQFSVITVPQNLFRDSDLTARLDYTAQQPGGLPLPDWLTFDPRSLSLYGTPPNAAQGTLEVEIVARDQRGNVALGEVRIRIGRSAAELLDLLRRQAARPIRIPAGLNRHAPVRGAPARPEHRPATERPGPDHGPAHPAPAPHADARPATPEPQGRAGFASQLRSFASADQAQRLLDALLT